MALRRILGVALLCHGVIAQLSGAANAPRRLRGRFLHISDIHPDEFYRVHSSTDEEEACHRGKGPAGVYGAETSDCDTPFALVDATFDWIRDNLKDDIDFVIWTGDSARHDSDEDIPRNQSQVLGTNRWIADKFVDLFRHPEEDQALEVPVVPTLGNNDILPHNILLSGPNPWLQHYTQIWHHFIPEEQRHSFEFGGWFFVEVIPNRLAIFSLNTLYFFDRNAGVDGCASPSEPGYKQMEWLRIQLQFIRQRGMKALLMGHVPPARTDSKRLWDETCWQKYTLWLQQYRDVVVGSLYGHMNIDHFLIQDTHDVELGLASGLSEDTVSTREAMEDELSIESATDYLQELRNGWSKLSPPPTTPAKSASMNDKKPKGGKNKNGRKGGNKKKRRDVWGERYQLSLVGPSIVPNYFPTLRVVEYNITGLEHAPVWADMPKTMPAPNDEKANQKHLDLRDISDYLEAEASKKKPKKKPSKDKKPKNPDLIIPESPSKTTAPGPGYSPQTLSLTGYTQYYANLTYINNVTLSSAAEPEAEPAESWLEWVIKRWRQGKHRGEKPVTKKPQPREFYFEVEYSTFTDKIYKLKDLTVNSYVDLAYRMGQRAKRKDVAEWAEDGEDDEDEAESEDEDSMADGKDEEEWDESEAVGAEKKGKGKGHGKKPDDKKGKKHKKKKGSKQNRAWLHFLKHAFVGTVEKQELKKLD
ncbi:Metallo-dependent phosphatase-like protein [Cercophora newfieldiana]|uniref:Endopolyphosphatase n=1 Tax=Cercophora newfieldiana TaxID=92897 RepID=A0AA39YP66_9PEZI|nr:Metallo-dependent phosphatase-like protein [Cercophora newfieldiana]